MASIGMLAWTTYIKRGGNKIFNLALACLPSGSGFMFGSER